MMRHHTRFPQTLFRARNLTAYAALLLLVFLLIFRWIGSRARWQAEWKDVSGTILISHNGGPGGKPAVMMGHVSDLLKGKGDLVPVFAPQMNSEFDIMRSSDGAIWVTQRGQWDKEWKCALITKPSANALEWRELRLKPGVLALHPCRRRAVYVVTKDRLSLSVVDQSRKNARISTGELIVPLREEMRFWEDDSRRTLLWSLKLRLSHDERFASIEDHGYKEGAHNNMAWRILVIDLRNRSIVRSLEGRNVIWDNSTNRFFFTRSDGLFVFDTANESPNLTCADLGVFPLAVSPDGKTVMVSSGRFDWRAGLERSILEFVRLPTGKTRTSIDTPGSVQSAIWLDR